MIYMRDNICKLHTIHAIEAESPEEAAKIFGQWDLPVAKTYKQQYDSFVV